MISRNLSGRLSRLEQRVNLGKQLKVVSQVTFVALVNDDDPRYCTWIITEQGKTESASFTKIVVYGRDLTHIEALTDEYRQQQTPRERQI